MTEERILRSVHKMKAMWEKHRPWLVKQGPSFPEGNTKNMISSFNRFRDRILKYYYPSNVLENLSETQREKLFRDKYPGRKVRHYDAQMKGGRVDIKETYKILPPRKRDPKVKGPQPYLTDGKGKVRQEIRDCLLIKPGPTAHLKCQVPFKVGHSPQKVYYQDPRFWENMLDLGDEELCDVDLKDLARINISGSWPSQYQDFQKMCDPTPHACTYDDLIKGVAVRSKFLQLPYLRKPTLLDLDYVKTNPSANPGFLSSRFFGAKHKTADKYCLPIARALFLNSSHNLCADTSCWSVGGRNRLQKQNEDGPLRSRFLLMPEAPNKIFGLAYAQPVYDALGIINWGDATNEIRIGGNDFHGNYYKWSDEILNKPYHDGKELDIKGHDLFTIEKSMVVAFGILRACYPDGEDVDRHFFFFMSGFIFKNVVVPGRFCYRVLKGIPTGSPFTSIIVSLVNWVNWSSTLVKYFGETAAEDSYVKVFGDDTLLGLSKLCNNPQPDEVGRIFKEHVGHTCSPCRNFDIKGDRNTLPTFLKYYPNYGLPARHFRDTLASASFVRKSNKYEGRYANVIKSLCYAGPFDFTGYKWLELFRRRLMFTHLSQCFPNWSADQLNRKINSALAITQRGVFKQYLFPVSLGYESPKNVDLGNKPKMFINATTNMSAPRIFGMVRLCMKSRYHASRDVLYSLCNVGNVVSVNKTLRGLQKRKVKLSTRRRFVLQHNKFNRLSPRKWTWLTSRAPPDISDL